MTNIYDSRLRRTSLAVLDGTTLLASVTNTYDNASRLASVTFGTNSATYGYLTNSALVETLTFKNGGTTRMTTSNRYDNLNRLTLKDSRAGATAVGTFGYAYNTANQRTAMTNTDASRWSYGYDTLGQVTSGKRSWADGKVVAGQQFEYAFDDIGNRKTAASGGDEWGGNLRYQHYTANSLNQYAQRTVPGFVDIQGSATNTATVTVNNGPTFRKSDYFRAELAVDNSTAPVWQGVTNVAVIAQGANPDIVTNTAGNVLLAKYAETFFHDVDGNQLSDSLWTNVWNGENRLIATETASGVPSSGKARQTWTHLGDGRWSERVVSTWNGSAYVAQSTNRFVWDGQVLVAIVNHTNGLLTSFPRGLDLSGSMQGAGGVGGVLAVNGTTNGVHFLAYDGNGNVAVLLSATNAAVTAQYEYSPFGETLRATGPMAKASPLRFSTQWADDVTGNAKYLYRDYLPAMGRWLSRDPMEERGGANLYAFVNNVSTWKYDYLGLWTKSGVLKLICKCRSLIPKDCLSKSTVYSYDKFIVTWDEYEKNPDGSKGKPKPGNPQRREAAGASGGGVIYLKNGMSDEEAAATLVHECEHQTSKEKDPNKQEVDVQVAEEQYRIDCGLPPMFPGSRTKLPDGREVPNRAAIEKHVKELYGNVYNQDPNIIQENFKEDVQGKKLEQDWKCP